MIPKIKISENVEKITNPGFKTIWRLFDKDTNRMLGDIIALDEEEPPTGESIEIFDPNAIWKKKTITNFYAKNLRERIFEGGKKVYESPDIKEIKKAIDSSEYNEENYRNMIFLIDRLNDKFNGYSKEIAVNDNNLKIYETTVETIEKTIEANRKNKEEYIAVKEYYGLLEDLRTLYSKDGIQKDLRSQSRPLIQKYTREFFEKFNFNYSDLILDDEYNISIYGPEGESNIEMVSGGEKIAIALALRLGITQAMSKGNIETILLDEPTIHLDTVRKQHLITVLRSMSVIPQMLIVTHDDELENAADTLIRVVKEDGISTVKINS